MAPVGRSDQCRLHTEAVASVGRSDSYRLHIEAVASGK